MYPVIKNDPLDPYLSCIFSLLSAQKCPLYRPMIRAKNTTLITKQNSVLKHASMDTISCFANYVTLFLFDSCVVTHQLYITDTLNPCMSKYGPRDSDRLLISDKLGMRIGYSM